jgi:hypothetical protein
MWACQQQKAPREFSISRAIVDVCSSASFRALRAASNIQYALFSALFVLPKASADYPNLSNNTSSNYNDFTPSQSNDSRVLADISNFKATSIGFPEWQARAVPIYSPSNLLVNTTPSLTKISAFWSINRIWSITT